MKTLMKATFLDIISGHAAAGVLSITATNMDNSLAEPVSNHHTDLSVQAKQSIVKILEKTMQIEFKLLSVLGCYV